MYSFLMPLLFNSEHLEQENKIDQIVSTLSREILSGNYDNVIINCGNFLLGEINGQVFPLIPELYQDSTGKITDQEKLNLCFKEGTLYNTKFSLKSLELGLNILLDAKSSPLAHNISLLPLISVDDKYVNRSLAKKYMQNGYDAIPSEYRFLLETAFSGSKNTKAILKIIPSIFSDSGQTVTNQFMLSENELVGRFRSIRKKHLQGAKQEYIDYQESLPDKTRKCSLELFHLLKTLVNQKDDFDKVNNNKLCILQFVPDACEGSAILSAKAIVKNRDDIDIISVVPALTGTDGFLVTKFTTTGSKYIETL